MMTPSFKYKLIAIAGTFDHLHKGHEHFISEAFNLGERVLVGVTSDGYVRKLKIKNQNAKIQIKYQKYSEREERLREFFKGKGFLDRCKIIKIEDIYGPAVEENEIEALVVTSETYPGARLVNEKRKEKKLPPLKIEKVKMVFAEDRRRISSTRIRIGEIDRWGRLYVKKMFSHPVISAHVRVKLKRPIGVLIPGNDKNHLIAGKVLKKQIGTQNDRLLVTVGDEVTKICNLLKITPHLSIVDFNVNRIPKYKSFEELGFTDGQKTITVENQPGYISRSLILAVKKMLKKCLTGEMGIIRVIGEEDLAGVPAILLAPLGSRIVYGQPGKGIVLVEVTEEKKKEVSEM